MAQLKGPPVASAEYWLAVVFALSQTVLKGSRLRLGSVAEFSRLWGQSADRIKAFLPVLMKESCKGDPVKALFESNRSVGQSAGKGKGKRLKAVVVTENGSPFAFDVHPLMKFSCATIGPAFGPILI